MRFIQMVFLPVFDVDGKTPLIPTKPSRARRWIKEGKATPFWKKGVWCVRLNIEPSAKEKQEIAVGIDPGSKREAYSVKSEAHTYLNIQVSTPDWIKDAVHTRKVMRNNRRSNTPYRQPRCNRVSGLTIGNPPPSSLARWQWKLRLSTWLSKLFPITCFVVEDLKAHTL